MGNSGVGVAASKKDIAILSSALIVLSALAILLLGVAHLYYTFSGAKLLPRDSGLWSDMNVVSPVISDQTTMWNAWIGFNASHSMGAMLFGLVFGYLALAQPSLLFNSIFLSVVGFLMLAGLFVLGWRYWFSIPFRGIGFALVCYTAGQVVARL